jgi:hypothetical protein
LFLYHSCLLSLQYFERFIPVSFQERLEPSDEEAPPFLLQGSGACNMPADNA